MSQLLEKIDRDLKEAMRAQNQASLSALRLLKTAVKTLEVAKKNKPVSDQELIGLIQKEIKKREESIGHFKKGARQDLADREEAEMKVLESYIPRQMDDQALERLVREILQAEGIGSKKDFGRAMKLVQEKAQGKADNRRISSALNRILS